MTVIDMAAERQARLPHATGPVKCLSCHAEWIAVSPAGTVWHECGSCGLVMGRRIGAMLKDEEHFGCDCGNELFRITDSGAYCAVCGVDLDMST